MKYTDLSMRWHELGTQDLENGTSDRLFCYGGVGQNTNLLPNGGFESGKPSLFAAEPGTSGATLTWATDQVRSGTRSLKIVKSGTAGSARWVSGNNVHKEAMGAIALRRTVEMIEVKNAVITHTLTPVELVVRDSSGVKELVVSPKIDV